MNNVSTIPVTVDSIKNLQHYRMTRCTYFSIENIMPLTEWSSGSDDINIQFCIIGLSGVITSPANSDLYFDTPLKLDALFDATENNTDLHVELNDIWLPNELFTNAGHTAERSQVYRIGYDLFKLAHQLHEEATSHEVFLNRMESLDIPVILEFSENETDALIEWNKEQIKINQELYHQRPEYKLQKKEAV